MREEIDWLAIISFLVLCVLVVAVSISVAFEIKDRQECNKKGGEWAASRCWKKELFK